MENISRIEKEMCTGCRVCGDVCPKAAIDFQSDEEGFVYPHVFAQCVHCGRCLSICPVGTETVRKDAVFADKTVYAACSKEEEKQKHSTSGGVFYELAKYVVEHGGIVAAVRYNEEFLAEHSIVDNVEQLSGFMQSKYIQSDTSHIYRKVKEAVDGNRQVLFVGTPCQCAAMKNFIDGSVSEKLVLCDFICRGVNSPMVYTRYLESVSRAYGNQKITKVWFKNKTYGWNRFATKIEFEDGSYYLQDRDHDPFMKGYIKKGLNLYMRKSCGNCQFKGLSRDSDLTLGDFWGIEDESLKKDVPNGISFVMPNSDKGKMIFCNIQDRLKCTRHSLTDVVAKNRCLLESAKPGIHRKDFFEKLENRDFLEIMDEY